MCVHFVIREFYSGNRYFITTSLFLNVDHRFTQPTRHTHTHTQEFTLIRWFSCIIAIEIYVLLIDHFSTQLYFPASNILVWDSLNNRKPAISLKNIFLYVTNRAVHSALIRCSRCAFASHTVFAVCSIGRRVRGTSLIRLVESISGELRRLTSTLLKVCSSDR